jgi:hypothetical protein
LVPVPPGLDDRRASDLVAQAGLVVSPISRHSLAPLPRGGLIFGGAATDEVGIRSGVTASAEVLDGL